MQNDRGQEPVQTMMPTQADAQHGRPHVVLAWLEVPQHNYAPVLLPAFSPTLWTSVIFPSLPFQLPDEGVLPPGGRVRRSPAAVVLMVHSRRLEGVREAVEE